MIIDQFGVFFDKEDVSSSMTSKAISLMPYAGRQDPVYISILANGGNTSTVTFTLELQESADNSTFSPVETFTVSKPDSLSVISSIRLPTNLTHKYCRLSVAVTGDPSGITLFAGVTRDHYAPYDEGLYIDKGKVVK